MTITSVNDGSSDKFYRAWADSADGSKGFSTTDSSKEYFGVYAGTTPPSNYKAYSWTKIKGEAGRSVTNTEMEYAINDSKTTPPTSGWSLEMPVWKTGLYIWQRVKVSYSTGNPSYTTPHCLESNIIDDVTGNIGDWIFRDKTDVLSGTEIFTNKADEDSVVHVEVDGKSYQHAGSGKNVFNEYILSDRSNFQLETYSTSPVFQLKPNTDYVISAKEITPSPDGYQIVLNVMNATNGVPIYGSSDFNSNIIKPIFNMYGHHTGFTNFSMPFTTPESGKISFSYFDGMRGKSPDGNWFTDVMTEPQMEEGLVATEYELPAPSPDYPIEIHSLNDFDVVSQKSEGGLIDGIELGGRNLALGTKDDNWDTYASSTANLASSDGNRTKSIKVTSKVSATTSFGIQQSVPNRKMKLKTGETYTLSFLVKGNVGTLNYVYLMNTGTSNQSVGYASVESETEFKKVSITFTAGVYTDLSTGTYIMISRRGDLTTNLWFEIQEVKLEKGNIATDWTPAPEDITENDNHPLIDKINLLLDEPLRSLGEIKDRLYRDSDGLWKIERKVGEYELNAKEEERWQSWYPTDNSLLYGLTTNSPVYNLIKTGSAVVSNKLVLTTPGASEIEGIVLSTNPRVRVRVLDSRIGIDSSSTAQQKIVAFKNWLKVNPVIFYYERESSLIETLSQSLQDKLNNLRTFKDSNYIYTILPDKSNILSENLKPTLHATFKSIAWANDFRYKFEQSKAMHSTDIWFAKGISNTIAPNIGWSTDAPVWEDGLYIWSKTITTYGDGRTEETSPVCITGATGRSVDKIEEWYYLSNKSDSLEGGAWSKTPPTWTNGKYIWTKNKIIYKNPSGTEETSPINTTGGSGQKGDSGTDAKTVRLGNIIHAVHFDQDGLMPSVASIAFPTAIQGFSGLTPYYEFKMGNTIVRGLSTDSSWTLNTSNMNYSDFPLTVSVNVVINGQIMATDTVTIVGTKPGEDAYTVVLANESHTFVGDVSNAIAGNTTANVIAYRGGTQVGATIGSITGLPTGMTSTIYSNGTTAARVTFTVTTSMTSPNGVVNIPVTVNGKTFTKVFNYAIAFKGAKGDKGTDGIAGKDGVGIKATVLAYASSTSGTTTPTSGWTTTVPTVAPGNYLWTRTTWTYTDNSVENGYSVSRIGKDGNTGNDGVAGKDGVGIKSTVIHYGGSTSGTSHSGVAWTTAIPSVPNGQFLWTRTTWTYDDNTTETGYSVAKMGETGAKGDKGDKGDRGSDGIAGKDGVGIKTTTLNYASSTNGTTAPTSGWATTIPTVAAGNYLWVRTTWTYTDNSTETGYSVSRIGKDGNTGSNGIPGKDGVGVKSTVISYTSSASGTTAPTSAWTSSVPSVAPGNFLWTRTVWTYTDNTTETTYSVARMGTNGATGAKGDKGNPGENATARNFLLDSKPSSIIHTAAYNIADFILAEAPISQETYSFVLKGELASAKTNFQIYNSDGSSWLSALSSIGNGLYVATFKWSYAGNSLVKIYATPSSVTAASKIEWVTMVKGSVPLTEWVPAHEDIYKYVDDVEVGGDNLLRVGEWSNYSSYNSIPRVTNGGRTITYVKNNNNSVAIRNTTLEYGPNVYYTLSGYAKINGTPVTNATWGVSKLASTYQGEVTHFSIRDSDGYFVITQNWTTNSQWLLHGSSIMHSSTGTITIDDFMVQRGTKATSWKLNPLDAKGGGRNYALGTQEEITIGGWANFYNLSPDKSDLNGVPATVSFWAKHESGSSPVILQAYFRTPAGNNLGYSYGSNQKTTTSYQKFVIPIDTAYIPSDLSGYSTIAIRKDDSTNIISIKGVKLEAGYGSTDYSPAIEDVQSSIGEKADSSATESALNEAAAKLQVLQQEVEAAATSNELKDFIDKYNKDMASRDKDARESESSLSSALASINSIETNMGDMSATWQFIDRFIKNTPQGIVVGNDSSGSYILIKEDRLAFYSNGQEVAFISQNLMEISRGAFVEQIQIAKYQFEESTTNHLTIRYVG